MLPACIILQNEDKFFVLTPPLQTVALLVPTYNILHGLHHAEFSCVLKITSYMLSVVVGRITANTAENQACRI